MKSMNKPVWVGVIGSVLLLVGGAYANGVLKQRPQYDFSPAKTAELQVGVSEDGEVKAAEDLALSFQRSGSVADIKAKVGDKVKKGQTLLALDNKDASASINQAAAAVQAAQAAYEKLVNGATNADVQVAQVALDNAKTNLQTVKQQQQVAVDNAYKALLNSGLAALPGTGNIGNSNPIISGTYTGSEQGQYNIVLYATGNGLTFVASGLENATGLVSVTPVPLGVKGLFIQFPNVSQPSGNTWTVPIPNTQAANYVSNYNAYQAALQTQSAALAQAQAQLDSAQAALDLKKAQARPEDVASAQAQVNSARALLQLAQNAYANGLVVAPVDGTITSVDVKIGESASPGKPVLKMISNQKFQVEAYLSESEVGQIHPTDSAQVTLDAYGNSAVFGASIVSLDPAASVVNGLKAYKLTLQFDQEDDRIKAGMGAHVVVAGAKKDNVLVVPEASIFRQNGQALVLIRDSLGKVREAEIQTGSVGLNGSVEVVGGLQAGDMVAVFGAK